MLKPHMIGRNGQRGRPRRTETAEGGPPSLLRVRRADEEDGVITLHLSGSLDLANLLPLRDAAFTAIGERPRGLCLDLRTIGPVEIAAINTLVTISRVARMVGVQFTILPSSTLRETLSETGLVRLLPPAPAPPGAENATRTAPTKDPATGPAPDAAADAEH